MADWMFWAAASAMALGVLAVLVQAMRQAPAGVEDAGQADLRIYRDQLTEIDRDVARGTLPQAEAVRLRTEVQRRLLEADRAVQAAPAARQPRGFLPGLAVVVVLIGGALWLYDRLGAPGYPDLPLKVRIALADAAYQNRPSQAEAEAAAPARPSAPVDPGFAALMDRLRQAVKTHPDDLRGLELLARNEAALGNFVAAKQAQTALIAAKAAAGIAAQGMAGEAAGATGAAAPGAAAPLDAAAGDAAKAMAVTAEDHAGLAEINILAAGGVVTADAEAALVSALQADPANGTARYYSGLMFAQVGRPDRAFAMWRPLLDEGPSDAPWIAPIRAQIEGVAMAAGVIYTLPEADAPGPDAADIAAAAEMAPEQRQAMIAGMVGQLSDRLARQGGPAADWARLITALEVLGELDRATAILAEAQGLFAANPEDAAVIRAAGQAAGLIP